MNNEAIRGFRIWFIRNSRLYPLTSGQAWDKINKATCSICKTSPGLNCGCGFNAFFQKPDDEILSETSNKLIWGEIAGRGRAEIYPAGFRVEEAQILSLISPPNKHNWLAIKCLKKRYGVTVFSDTKNWGTEPLKKGETENLLGFSLKDAQFFEQLQA